MSLFNLFHWFYGLEFWGLGLTFFQAYLAVEIAVDLPGVDEHLLGEAHLLRLLCAPLSKSPLDLLHRMQKIRD